MLQIRETAFAQDIFQVRRNRSELVIEHEIA